MAAQNAQAINSNAQRLAAANAQQKLRENKETFQLGQGQELSYYPQQALRPSTTKGSNS